MSAEEQIVEKIYSAGQNGVKKIELKKEFSGINFDKVTKDLVEKGEIILDRKGVAHYFWHKNHYFQNLMNIDPKFKYLYDKILNMNKSLNAITESVNLQLQNIESNISNLTDSVINSSEKINTLEQSKYAAENDTNYDTLSYSTYEPTFSLESFKDDFDLSIINNGTSIGWVELSKIKTELCEKYEITEKEFYSYVKQLIQHNETHYELSTGGNEGIVVRGLIHGFVRCI
ncbi:MAG: hypothetical protein DA328_00195 [Nitrososphaeraceae archaeon]|nr:hypothetical protein [Nitrososphaeraceae archaeon]